MSDRSCADSGRASASHGKLFRQSVLPILVNPAAVRSTLPPNVPKASRPAIVASSEATDSPSGITPRRPRDARSLISATIVAFGRLRPSAWRSPADMTSFWYGRFGSRAASQNASNATCW